MSEINHELINEYARSLALGAREAEKHGNRELARELRERHDLVFAMQYEDLYGHPERLLKLQAELEESFFVPSS